MAAESTAQGSVGAPPVPTSALALVGLAVASIWLCVGVASVNAPDFVSGSHQEHLALVPWTDWIWGLVATSFVVLAALQGVRSRVQVPIPWIGLAIGVGAVWILVALVSVLAPVAVTGTDPTIIPSAALGIPILGTFLTWFVCAFVKALFEQYKS